MGRIENYALEEARTVVALPANEYFDDECVSDVNSALGAYVDRHFKDSLHRFLDEIQAALRGLPCERVPRAERRIDDSYGIGQAIYLRGLAPTQRFPEETKTYRVSALLMSVKKKKDKDVHLVIADPRVGGSMIIEFPASDCIGTIRFSISRVLTAPSFTTSRFKGAEPAPSAIP